MRLLNTILLSVIATTLIANSAIAQESQHRDAQRNIEQAYKAIDKLLSDAEYQSAIDTLESRDALSPKDYQYLIDAYLNVDLDDAEDAAQRAIDAYPSDYRMYLSHASVMGAQASDSIFSALGYAEKALNSLEKAVSIEPNNPQTLSALISFYIAAPSIAGGDMEKAQQLVDQISILDEIEGKFNQARVYFADDQSEKGEALLLSMIEQTPAAQPSTLLRAHYLLGNHYRSSEDYDRSIAHFEKAAQVNLLQAPAADSRQAKDAYESARWRQLYAKYNVGRVALLADAETAKGIAFLEQYLHAYERFEYSSRGLPSPAWAKLRLSELLLDAKNIERARATFASINIPQNKDYKNIHKKLAKTLRKAD
ncbi:hypothetical protein PN836_012655 [Ningiella sp. W23]|uniref:tetratricopeptide repeat protein n=1 Tax=Ningiella sp. W23 TaxID=3023715 RepID=UPI0037578954